ncbi:hypothetical protein SELMODRAFT_271535 [Selaginella moellendorffii]|uniref:B box-type domain-containing protein n=1 Tax=Selaginella moellendorffii TaxID=88036 RepID=D8SFJ7_SELML|nr:B-box zinc finger protein 25 isoform X1 [Selaginella moellendorffii]XP_024543018.1 B-box zinc finger protein 25 isoform X1 [Selaginella moellendorffii]EFJ16738.1 hypothetical protein SELMODRAFT_271535 [Selaginella moellendorffii]|eukprot:XP_002982070.1 B-box zinc finger protein 25 isoform X1 [Selaginella moellendorffii]
MRIQCDVCEKAEAALVCCADEAALCAACDAEVHAANKLAGKHQRLPLSFSGTSPICDICQEKTGWFFCVEDRALLCRACDVSIHSSNAHASSHNRFLVTGVRVALSALSAQDFLEVPPVTPQQPRKNASASGASSSGNSLSANGTPERFETVSRAEPETVMEKRSTSSTISEYLTEAVPGWRVDELLNIPDMASGYSLSDIGSSKAEAGNLGEYDWLADLSLFDEQSYAETFHEVPQMTPSTMPASKLPPAKGKSKLGMAVVPEVDDSLLVPDVSFPAKRRRAWL